MLNHPASQSTGLTRTCRAFAVLAALLLAASVATACKKDEGKTGPEATPDTPTTDKADEKDPAQTPEQKPAQAPPAADGVPTLAEAKGTYSVDEAHSTVVFRAKHMGVSYTYGRFNKMTGTLTLDPDLAKSSVSLEVDADSVFTANKDRDAHLEGPDFFNVKEFPKVTFKSTQIEQAGPGKYKVTGDLTLHGVTKPVTATFDHVGAGPNVMDKSQFLTGFHGYLTIKRSDFGMTYGVGAVSDEVDLMVAIEALRK